MTFLWLGPLHVSSPCVWMSAHLRITSLFTSLLCGFPLGCVCVHICPLIVAIFCSHPWPYLVIIRVHYPHICVCLYMSSHDPPQTKLCLLPSPPFPSTCNKCTPPLPPQKIIIVKYQIGEDCTWRQLSFSSRLAIEAPEAADLMLFMDCALFQRSLYFVTSSLSRSPGLL